jgi:hypothetical protein
MYCLIYEPTVMAAELLGPEVLTQAWATGKVEYFDKFRNKIVFR